LTNAGPLESNPQSADIQAMAKGRTPNSSESPEQGSNRRNYRRRPQQVLESNYGPVLDLSAGGIRLISSRALSGIVKVSISGKGIDQMLQARVLRCTKISFRVYEVALEFVDHQNMRHVVEWISRWSSMRRAS
jgi:hypothetical protein